MRWKKKEVELPNGGDKRTRRAFAWRRTRVNEWTVWLEWYESTETYFQPAGGGQGWWRETSLELLEWKDLAKRIRGARA